MWACFGPIQRARSPTTVSRRQHSVTCDGASERTQTTAAVNAGCCVLPVCAVVQIALLCGGGSHRALYMCHCVVVNAVWMFVCLWGEIVPHVNMAHDHILKVLSPLLWNHLLSLLFLNHHSRLAGSSTGEASEVCWSQLLRVTKARNLDHLHLVCTLVWLYRHICSHSDWFQLHILGNSCFWVTVVLSEFLVLLRFSHVWALFTHFITV